MPTTREEKRTYWFRHVKAWRSSGETQRSYCQHHQLKPHQLTYWKHVFEAKSETAPAQPSNGFIPVQMTAPASQGLTLRIPGGMCIEGIQANNLALTREIMGWLA